MLGLEGTKPSHASDFQFLSLVVIPTYMLFYRPEHGSGTGVGHFLLNEPVNFLKEGEEIVPQLDVRGYLPGFDQIGGVKQHAKPYNIACWVTLYQSHYLKNLFLLPHVSLLPTNTEVHHNYRQLTIGRGKLKIMFYQRH